MKQAFLKMHLAVLVWGFSGILGRAISLSAPVLVYYRLFLAASILGLILVLRKKWQPIPLKDIFKLAGIGILVSIHWLCFYGCIKQANVSIAVVCLATASIFVALINPFINGGKIRFIELVVGIVAVAGVLCIYVLHREAGIKPKQPMVNFRLGLFLGLSASVISAVFTAFNKPLAEKYTARPLVFWEMLSGFCFLTCLLPFYVHRFPHVSFRPVGWDFLWIFLLGYCCTVWGQSLAMSALKKLSAFTATITVNLEPVYSIILAFLIFKENEQLGFGFYVGMILIFLSVAFQIFLSVKLKKKSEKSRTVFSVDKEKTRS